ncbi:hypothetical protein CIPAW_02G060400 [Carya illinoinensis]|uniref:Uncharacterized protein n=1 Tax=Carya illinoinensis TaxID=32201 RepID=A0A8T1RC88_CARIL|nr:hypothetical protein CIPAW_02G060400 [Carya illinoinensis]
MAAECISINADLGKLSLPIDRGSDRNNGTSENQSCSPYSIGTPQSAIGSLRCLHTTHCPFGILHDKQNISFTIDPNIQSGHF